jgi:hypothetical protein
MGQDFKFHLVKWKQVCTPIRYGGLGIQTAVRQMELKIWHCKNGFMATSDYLSMVAYGVIGVVVMLLALMGCAFGRPLAMGGTDSCSLLVIRLATVCLLNSGQIGGVVRLL